jgi:pyruvate/2-oxoglutarate dehydrogenase complex dihydrolipoamide dehydrogenase (E3) component
MQPFALMFILCALVISSTAAADQTCKAKARTSRRIFNEASAALCAAGGVPGFFDPRIPPAVLMPQSTREAISVYDTGPLQATLHELVDFDLLNSGAIRLSIGEEEVSLVVRTESGERIIEGSDILVAAGRVPNTAGIGLEEAGVELDDRGYIRVNERLETSAPGVWAVGECAGSPQFTHVSEDDFQIIRDNFAGGRRSTRDRLVPYCVFTDPPLAHVGMREGEAQRQGVAARVAKLPTSAVLRAQAIGEKQGFMKLLVAATDDRILGFTMIGSEAGEVMAAVQIAMLGGMPYSALRDAIFAHPTMAEGLDFLLANVPPRSGQPVTQSASLR